MKISEYFANIATEIAKDEEKFDKGNSSAGTRLRKTLQEVKKFCGEKRLEIQSTKNAAN